MSFSKSILLTAILFTCATNAFAIRKGRLAKADEYPAVVKLMSLETGEKKKEGGGVSASVLSSHGCTGTLIGTWLLTAEHCAKNLDREVVYATTSSGVGLQIDSKRVFKHATADMALIGVKGEAREAYSPSILANYEQSPISRFDSRKAINARVILSKKGLDGTLVGFGKSGEKEEEEFGIITAKKRVGTFSALGSLSVIADVLNAEAILVLFASPSIADKGDSGGPFFAPEDGEEKLHSVLYGGKDDWDFIVSVPETRRWILETMAKDTELKSAVKAWEEEKAVRAEIQKKLIAALRRVENGTLFDLLDNADGTANDKIFTVAGLKKMADSEKLSAEERKAFNLLSLPAVSVVLDTFDTKYTERDGVAALANIPAMRAQLEKKEEATEILLDKVRLGLNKLQSKTVDSY